MTPAAKGSLGKALLAGAATLLFAGAVTAGSIVHIAQKFAPQLALDLSPGNAQANDRMAAITLAQGGTKPDAEQLRAYARRSLETQALNPVALRNAGLAAGYAEDREQARRIFALAQSLSRRDSMAGIWIFEDLVRQGRIREGLTHLDAALRIDESAQSRIYPALAQLLANPQAAAQFAPFMRAKPNWALGFASFAVNDDLAGPVFGRMVARYPFLAELLPQHRQRTLAQRLAELREYDVALGAYSVFTGQPRQVRAYRDGYFDTTGWVPFDWQPGATGDLSTFRAPKGQGIEFTVSGGGQQTVANRLLRLAPGAYTLSTAASAEDGRLGDLGLRIQISCAGQNGTRLLRAGWVTGAPAALRADFAIPAGCPLQSLEIRAGGQRSEHSGTVAPVVIAAR